MIKSRCEEAVKCYNEGFNCCQAVFSAYSEQLGLNRETALKIASPFGGGIVRMGDTCGAVTGALMLIGLKEGKYLAEDNDSREKCYKLSQEFINKFKELYGSILCKDILSCDISTESGQKFAREHNLFRTLCPGFVRDASKIVETLLELVPAVIPVDTPIEVQAEVSAEIHTEVQEEVKTEVPSKVSAKVEAEVAAAVSLEVPAEKSKI